MCTEWRSHFKEVKDNLKKLREEIHCRWSTMHTHIVQWFRIRPLDSGAQNKLIFLLQQPCRVGWVRETERSAKEVLWLKGDYSRDFPTSSVASFLLFKPWHLFINLYPAFVIFIRQQIHPILLLSSYFSNNTPLRWAGLRKSGPRSPSCFNSNST